MANRGPPITFRLPSDEQPTHVRYQRGENYSHARRKCPRRKLRGRGLIPSTAMGTTMKMLKSIFQNALILATLLTMVAGAILVAYADRQSVDARKAQGVALQADEGVPQNLVAASGARRGGSGMSKEADEGKPPGIAA